MNLETLSEMKCICRMYYENDYLFRRRIMGKKNGIFLKMYGVIIHHFRTTKELKLAGETHGTKRIPFETNSHYADRLNKGID